jgi:broad specificity phosphatase PhoE
MTRLVLCRHGEAEGAAGRFCGSFDPALSAAGRRQAAALAAVVGESALYSSPARRALETAAAMGREPIVEQDLRELDFGEAEGLTYDDVAERWPDVYAAWLRAPTEVRFPVGEAFADFRARVLAALGRIEDGVVVTHGGVIRTALAHWLDMPDDAIFRIDVGHGAVSVVEWQDGTPLVRLVNAPPASLARGG